jgi:amino acid transporter
LAQDGEKDVVSHLYQAGEDLEGTSPMEGKGEPQQQLYRWMAIISLFLSVVSLAVVCGLGSWLAFSLACPFHAPYPGDNQWIRVICSLAVYIPSFLAMILGIRAGYKVRTSMALTSAILGIVLFMLYVAGNPLMLGIIFFTDGAVSCRS